MIADIFQAKVERIEISNSAALGAAMRAANASAQQTWYELNNFFTAAKSQIHPNTANKEVYEQKLKDYALLIEQH